MSPSAPSLPPVSPEGGLQLGTFPWYPHCTVEWWQRWQLAAGVCRRAGVGCCAVSSVGGRRGFLKNCVCDSLRVTFPHSGDEYLSVSANPGPEMELSVSETQAELKAVSRKLSSCEAALEGQGSYLGIRDPVREADVLFVSPDRLHSQ